MPAVESGVDRRQCCRTPVAQWVTLLIESDRRNICHDAFAIDLSQTGAQVRDTRSLTPGQYIDFVTKPGRLRFVPARVVWVRATEAEHVAGLEFLEPTEYPQVLLEVPAGSA